MADQLQESQTNNNLISGSYLSAENRKRIFNFGVNKNNSKTGIKSINSIVPVRSSITPESLTPVIDKNTSEISLLREQIASLNAKNLQLTSDLEAINILQNQIIILRSSINTLGSTLGQIGSLIDLDSKLDTQKNNQELENERKLAQRSIREGKESELEKKIQISLITPIREVSSGVQNTLFSLVRFFGILFGGWLTNQGIEALRASFSNNKRKLTDIKNTVISNLAIVGGIFSAFRFGIGRTFFTILNLSSKVGNFILANTVGKLFDNLLKFIPGFTPKPPGPTSPNPSGNKPSGGIGTLFGTAMEAFQGNWLEAGLGAAAFLPGIPGAIAKGAFWLEQGLDLFGKGVIPEDNTQIKLPQSIQLPDIKDLFKSSDNTPINSTNQQDTSSITAPKPLTAIAEAPKISLPQTLSSPNTSEASKPQEKMVSSPTSNLQTLDIKPQFTLSPQLSEFQFSSERINVFDTFSASNPESLLDFSKSPLYGRVKINTSEQNQEIQNPQQERNNFSDLIPIQSRNIQTVPFDIRPEPEPKPTIVYQKTSSQQSASGSTPLKTGAATNVPIIASSNLDNMYTLYSQSNYNVII